MTRGPAVALILLGLLLLACGDDGSDRLGDAALTERLIEENTRYFAFGCTDIGGTALSDDESADAIAEAADIEHAAAGWVSDMSVVILGDDGDRSIIIYDPSSEPTNVAEFEEREVAFGEGTLVCLIPE